MNSKRTPQWLLAIVFFTIGVSYMHSAAAQAQEGSKGIESKEVVERRSNTLTASPTPVTKPRRPVSYRSSKPFGKRPPAAGTEHVKVGLTIWRLQGDGSKGFDQVGEEAQTLEQVEANTQLSIGSSVRLGIETLTRDGYLYVIDREQFADGAYGAARLIFPTMRTRKGNNRVSVNERVLIPRRPSYFRINPSSTGKPQVAEVLSIIISPTQLQLPGPLGDKPMTLSAEQFKEWESKWSAPVNQFEIEGGAGETTGAKDLGQVGDESQRLTEDDPLPQTVYL